MKLPSGTEFNAIDIAIGATRQPMRDSLPIAYWRGRLYISLMNASLGFEKKRGNKLSQALRAKVDLVIPK
jgi:hypothetical protein